MYYNGEKFQSKDGLKDLLENNMDGDPLYPIIHLEDEDIEVAFATTIHKSQGSEYHTVIVVVPPVGSPLLRRELLYTAVTRARKHLVLIASEDAITSAVMSTINRASGLAARVRG